VAGGSERALKVFSVSSQHSGETGLSLIQTALEVLRLKGHEISASPVIDVYCVDGSELSYDEVLALADRYTLCALPTKGGESR